MCILGCHCYEKDIYKYILYRHRISLVIKIAFWEEHWMVGGRGGREILFWGNLVLLYMICTF